MFRSFSLRVLFITFFTLVLTGLPFAFIFNHFHRKTVIKSLQVNNQNLMRILVNQLERFMKMQQPHLTEDYLLDIAAHSNVERTMIMTKSGKVTYSSDPLFIERHFIQESALCQSCHEKSPPLEQKVVKSKDEQGREMLQLVSVVANRTSCHSCHDPKKPYIGIIAMDIPVSSLMSEMKISQIQILAIGVWMLLVTLIVLTFVLEKQVVSPVKKTVKYLENLTESGMIPPSKKLLQMPLIGKLVRTMAETYSEVLDHKKKLQDNKNFLQSVLDSLEEEIVVIDRNRQIILANKAFQENVPTEKRDPICLRESEECLALKSLQSKETNNYTLKENGKIYQITTIPLSGKDLVIEVRNNITDIQEIEKRLMQSERLAFLGFIAASVAHQLNTPLATISALIEAMEREGKEENKRIGKMAAALNRLKDLGKQLVFLSMAPEEKEQDIDIGLIIEKSIQLIQGDFQRCSISTTISIPKNNITIRGYPLQVEQIFLNVMMNAMQAMTEGGALTVTLDHKDDFIRIAIEDTGSGIKKENLNQIFDPTFTTKGKKGTGFGLFLVKNFIENMSGQVDIESRVGVGTKVILSFPRGHYG